MIDVRFVDQARRDLASQPKLTLARLHERLRYDPETGFFHKKVFTPGRNIGKRAGWKGIHGRWTIELDGHSYLAARLAWLYMTGEWPKHEVDHINQDKTDDRFCNLREATRSQNQANRRQPSRPNRSGFCGVHKYRSKWIAQISCGKRDAKKHLGVFDTPEEAHAAYLVEAEKRFEGFAASKGTSQP